jgi:hypothetical protein
MRRLLWLPLAAALASCAMGVETLPAKSHIVNSAAAGLPDPPNGYSWFRNGPEFVLAAKLSGRVVRAVPAPSEALGPVDAFGPRRP